MENEAKNFFKNKINLTLPNKSKQKKLIKDECKTKRNEISKNMEKTPNLSSKIRKSYKRITKEINLKSDKNNLRDKTLKKLKEKYHELINRIKEDKKDLDNLNKMYDCLVVKTENNYTKNNLDKNKNKDLIKNNNNNNINFFNVNYNKKFNDSVLLFDQNKNYNSINNEIFKDNTKPTKIFDKNKIKKISLNKVIPKSKNIDIISQRTLNNYITVNQNNNISKRSAKNLNKTTNNHESNSYINCNRFKIKKIEKNINIFNLRNNNNKNDIGHKFNYTPKQKIRILNNDNSLYENNNIHEKSQDNKYIKMIKITDLNNNFHKNKSSSTIYYSPDNFYHNIINYKQMDNYINIENYNEFKNENINNNKKYFSDNKNKKIFNTKAKINNNNFNNVNKKRNLKNKIKINEKFEPKNNKKSDISLYSFERNTISYLYPESNQNINNHIFKLNELFSRDNLNKNLKVQNPIDEKEQKIPFTKVNISLIQNENDNTKNKSEKNKINKNNKSSIIIKSINYNDNNMDNSYKTYNNETPNLYFNKNKIYNKSLPKINIISDLYNKNLTLNNHFKETQSTISSKITYTDFNIPNLSSIKKSEKDLKVINKNENIYSSRRKLSNSFNKEYINKENNLRLNNDIKENIDLYTNKDNLYYKKQNYSLLYNKEDSHSTKIEDDKNSIKNNYIPNNINTEDYTLDSKSTNIKQNEEFISFNIKTENNRSLSKGLYIKPLKINSKSKNKNNNIEDNSINKKKLYKKKSSQHHMASKKIIINNSIESFNVKNNIINYMKKPVIKLRKTKENNNENNNIVDKSIDIQEYKDNIVFYSKYNNIECYKIDKTNICCFYKKLCNYYIKKPPKNICYIEKVKRKNRNKKNFKNYASFNKKKNKILGFEDIKFNGRNIISEKKQRNTCKRIRKINGKNNIFINFDLLKEKKKDILTKTERNIYKKVDRMNITPNRNTKKILDNFNSPFANSTNDIYKNYISQTSSKIYNQFNKNQLIKNELPKNIKICLATNKLNNIFLTKNENEDTKRNISLEKEIFELGCSKLNNILHKKTFNCNLDLCHSQKMKTISYNFIQKNEDEINKKTSTYKPKNKSKGLEEQLYKEENNYKIKEEKTNDIKNKIINLLNNINENNIKTISEIIVGIILFIKEKDKIMENEIKFVNCIFEKLNKEKNKLGIYIELCKNMNYILLNESKKEINLNKENNLINVIIKEFYEILYNKKQYNKFNSENEKELDYYENKFLELINFISELIMNKLIVTKESINIIQNIFNEYDKNSNKIKYIFLNANLILINTLLKTNENIFMIDNFIENKLKIILNDNSISDNIKDKINLIINKCNEIKRIENTNNYKNEIFCIPININEIYCDENGGIPFNIENENITEEVSFKIDNKDNQNQNKYIPIENDKEENNIFLNNEILDNINNNLTENNNKSNKKNHNVIHKKKSKKKSNSLIINSEFNINDNYNIIINEKDKIIYNQILEDFENYFEFLDKKGIKTKNDLYIDINYSYNWKIIDDLIMVKKVKLEEIIKIIIEIFKNKKDIDINDIFKINEYIKTIIEYYSNDLSNNQINIFRLNMIEIYMDIDNIIDNSYNSDIIYEILGNLLFILLKNKLYYIKDLNNFIDKSKDTQIKICKVVKFAIISSGYNAKQYINDFKYTKLFNNSDMFVNYVINELSNKVKM